MKKNKATLAIYRSTVLEEYSYMTVPTKVHINPGENAIIVYEGIRVGEEGEKYVGISVYYIDVETAERVSGMVTPHYLEGKYYDSTELDEITRELAFPIAHLYYSKTYVNKEDEDTTYGRTQEALEDITEFDVDAVIISVEDENNEEVASKVIIGESSEVLVDMCENGYPLGISRTVEHDWDIDTTETEGTFDEDEDLEDADLEDEDLEDDYVDESDEDESRTEFEDFDENDDAQEEGIDIDSSDE